MSAAPAGQDTRASLVTGRSPCPLLTQRPSRTSASRIVASSAHRVVHAALADSQAHVDPIRPSKTGVKRLMRERNRLRPHQEYRSHQHWKARRHGARSPRPTAQGNARAEFLGRESMQPGSRREEGRGGSAGGNGDGARAPVPKKVIMNRWHPPGNYDALTHQRGRGWRLSAGVREKTHNA